MHGNVKVYDTGISQRHVFAQIAMFISSGLASVALNPESLLLALCEAVPPFAARSKVSAASNCSNYECNDAYEALFVCSNQLDVHDKASSSFIHELAISSILPGVLAKQQPRLLQKAFSYVVMATCLAHSMLPTSCARLFDSLKAPAKC